MIREGSLEDISDGKLYRNTDLVKVGTDGCRGCHACCEGMGRSIVLDPLDIHRLSLGTGMDFSQLLETSVELNVVDGMILPNLRMQGGSDSCIYLNEEGRCSIHGFRPGICRLFPLGRYYHDGGFSYILQTGECVKGGRSKLRVSQWIGIEDMKGYEIFCLSWHDLQKRVQRLMRHMAEEHQRSVSMYILKLFYMQAYDAGMDFYLQYNARLSQMQTALISLEKAAGLDI